MHDKEYPYDIHGYSQGIISFTAAGDLDFPTRIAHSAIEDMWHASAHRFFYQKHRYSTARFTLMRWCQAWMCYALSALSVAKERDVQA
jgi:hypothetical protein